MAVTGLLLLFGAVFFAGICFWLVDEGPRFINSDYDEDVQNKPVRVEQPKEDHDRP